MTDQLAYITTIVGTSLFVLSVLLLVYELFFHYPRVAAERVRELIDDQDFPTQASIFKDDGAFAGDNAEETRTWNEWITNLIDQAGLTWSPKKLLLMSIAVGLLGSLALAFRFGWMGCFFFPMGGLFFLGVLYVRRHSRRRRLCQQLPEVFQIISRAVRAGQTVPAALQIIAEDFEPPISEEFIQCHEQQKLGMRRESALRRLAQRTGVMELQIFVVALLVQSRSGGDLVELLDNLTHMATKRLKLRDRVKALTGEGRLQALVLIVLPIAALCCLVLFSPDYASTLLERPTLLVFCAVAQLVGALWIRRIVSFEV